MPGNERFIKLSVVKIFRFFQVFPCLFGVLGTFSSKFASNSRVGGLNISCDTFAKTFWLFVKPGMFIFVSSYEEIKS